MNILIIGKNSYIGKNLKAWLNQYPGKYKTSTISVRDDRWKSYDFSKFDTVINCAGVAHINNIQEGMKNLFYSVNRDLVYELGKKAKNDGVSHFIHFSSMNVYGDYCDNITNRDVVNPTSFYGDSKLQGDFELEKLKDNSFVISYIRPPFVYGKDCSGNFKTISKIAHLTPIFPNYKNKKSMIYIDNLCEFIRLIIDDKKGGVFTPQNKELISTTDLVAEIAINNNKKILFTKLFNWILKLGNKKFKTIRRAFGNDCYDLSLSDYYDFKYCVVNFQESIRRTEIK
ncbi:NAD-dependent epimerase/dehydratase family protein [Holdemanella biformis]|uniref:NAD-dependent epimerase/dehydratase family protein n=1 Tax=Holdemanella biformis TaxID=1735 RepID=UPI0022E3CB54|nr:NAD-dependent epimerase/dehydratase family protein [Holdemanella biformis]